MHWAREFNFSSIGGVTYWRDKAQTAVASLRIIPLALGSMFSDFKRKVSLALAVSECRIQSRLVTNNWFKETP